MQTDVICIIHGRNANFGSCVARHDGWSVDLGFCARGYVDGRCRPQIMDGLKIGKFSNSQGFPVTNQPLVQFQAHRHRQGTECFFQWVLRECELILKQTFSKSFQNRRLTESHVIVASDKLRILRINRFENPVKPLFYNFRKQDLSRCVFPVDFHCKSLFWKEGRIIEETEIRPSGWSAEGARKEKINYKRQDRLALSFVSFCRFLSLSVRV